MRARYTNTDLAEYLIPVNADIETAEVILVPEEDSQVNDLGIKGLGELGNVGTNAAVANAVYHATGIRVREATDVGSENAGSTRRRSHCDRRFPFPTINAAFPKRSEHGPVRDATICFCRTMMKMREGDESRRRSGRIAMKRNNRPIRSPTKGVDAAT